MYKTHRIIVIEKSLLKKMEFSKIDPKANNQIENASNSTLFIIAINKQENSLDYADPFTLNNSLRMYENIK